MEKLALGAVQLGLPYGAANETGMPSIESATAIVRVAVDSAVPFIDTASIYGESEERIGAAFAALGVAGQPEQPTVVTKVDMEKIVDPDATAEGVVEAVDASVAQSLERLRTGSLDVLLLHNFLGYSQVHDGAAWKRLVELRDDGVGELPIPHAPHPTPPRFHPAGSLQRPGWACHATRRRR